MGTSYNIDFNDGSVASIPQSVVNLVPRVKPTPIMKVQEEVDTTDNNVSDDSDFVPDVDDPFDDDDEPSMHIPPCTDAPSSSGTSSTSFASDNIAESSCLPPLKNSEVYLCHLGKDIFKGTYNVRDDKFVHGKELDEFHGRFFITKVLQKRKQVETIPS